MVDFNRYNQLILEEKDCLPKDLIKIENEQFNFERVMTF